MASQCFNYFNYRSFNLFPPFHAPLKPYAATPRPVFPFHGSLIVIGRRSGNKTSSLPPPLATESSSDVVLVATKEHHDGSLIFQFGDASEVVENDEVVEEIESKAELDFNSVKVLDIDQEREVVEGEFVSDISKLTEVADEITNADIDSDIVERESTVTNDLKDYHAESIERLSHIPEEEVLSSQFDAKINESFKDVESTLDKTECYETEDQLVSVKIESMQASDTEVMDVKQPYEKDELNMVEIEDASESNTEDIKLPASMHKLDVELTDTANEELQDMNINGVTLIDEIPSSDLLEAEPLDDLSELQSVDVKVDATMDVSSTEAMYVKDSSMEIELQEVSMNKSDENDVVNVMPVSGVEDEEEPVLENDEIDPQPTPGELQPTMQVSDFELHNPDDVILQINDATEDPSVSENTNISDMTDLPPQATKYISDAEIMDTENEVIEEVLQDKYINEGTFINEKPPYDSSVSEQVLDDLSQLQLGDVNFEANMEVSTTKVMDVKEEVSQFQSTPLELNPTMEVSDMELENTMSQNLDDGILQVIDETEDPSESVNLETEKVSDIEVMDELLEVEDAEESNTNEVTLIDEMRLEAEPTFYEVDATMEVSTTKGMDVKDLIVEDELEQVSSDNRDEDDDVAYVMPEEPILKEEVIQPVMQVEDAEGKNLDDGILQVIDEDAGDGYVKDVERLLHQLEAQLENHVLEEYAEVDSVGSSILLEQGASGSQLEAERIEGNLSSSSEVTEASEMTPILLATEPKVEREENYLTGYFLSSGAALLEHPFEALTGGDDAYFVSSSKWLGVANGVSQWSFEGTDRGVYAQELMRTCEKIVLNTTSVPITNSVELLCRCVKETHTSGSSNILIANFNGQSLHVANIGDTGFLIIRHGAVYKKSSPLLHEFHFALQVEDRDDPLQLVEEYIIELDEGDIVVSATDGLFDNLYEKEIAMAVSKSLQAGMKPEEVAKVLATRAQEVGKSVYVRSPFSDAAQAAGYTGYTGGKQDNVAVVVSLVEKISTS